MLLYDDAPLAPSGGGTWCGIDKTYTPHVGVALHAGGNSNLYVSGFTH